ncbi:hypothetical protein [Nocardia brasiliensis]|uniref:hypothetical protein n=1 Tax=Nocardia brasiliensis TaxID=37326 RepID=UPI002456F234|nr:hypothetical protein [Nocardia brasiliensis]
MMRRERSGRHGSDSSKHRKVDVVCPADPPELNPDAAKALLRLILRCAEKRPESANDAEPVVQQRLTGL